MSTLPSPNPRRIRRDDVWLPRVDRPAEHRIACEVIDAGTLGDEDVEVAVELCGPRHSDLSVWKNAWGISRYPATVGREVVGRITVLGPVPRGSLRRRVDRTEQSAVWS